MTSARVQDSGDIWPLRGKSWRGQERGVAGQGCRHSVTTHVIRRPLLLPEPHASPSGSRLDSGWTQGHPLPSPLAAISGTPRSQPLTCSPAAPCQVLCVRPAWPGPESAGPLLCSVPFVPKSVLSLGLLPRAHGKTRCSGQPGEWPGAGPLRQRHLARCWAVSPFGGWRPCLLEGRTGTRDPRDSTGASPGHLELQAL